MAKKLRIIPLGGLGEIGKNMTVLEYGRNMMMIDCGVMFPESDMYGIDLVLPQFDYVVQNQEYLRGIVLTHGHLDHIGGLPYLLRQIKTHHLWHRSDDGHGQTPVGRSTGAFNRRSFKWWADKDTFQLGPFKISLFPVAHSIPGSVGLVIDTPVGAVVHTGDYKLDETPAGGQTTDLDRLRQLTPNGVLALLADSTNADKPGRTPTEQIVADELDRLFSRSDRRAHYHRDLCLAARAAAGDRNAGEEARAKDRADGAQPGRKCRAGARTGIHKNPGSHAGRY